MTVEEKSELKELIREVVREEINKHLLIKATPILNSDGFFYEDGNDIEIDLCWKDDK